MEMAFWIKIANANAVQVIQTTDVMPRTRVRLVQLSVCSELLRYLHVAKHLCVQIVTYHIVVSISIWTLKFHDTEPVRFFT